MALPTRENPGMPFTEKLLDGAANDSGNLSFFVATAL